MTRFSVLNSQGFSLPPSPKSAFNASFLVLLLKQQPLLTVFLGFWVSFPILGYMIIGL